MQPASHVIGKVGRVGLSGERHRRPRHFDRPVEAFIRGVRRGERVEHRDVAMVRELRRAFGELYRLGRTPEPIFGRRCQQPREVGQRRDQVGIQLHRLPVLGDGFGPLALEQERAREAAARPGHIGRDLKGAAIVRDRLVEGPLR